MFADFEIKEYVREFIEDICSDYKCNLEKAKELYENINKFKRIYRHYFNNNYEESFLFLFCIYDIKVTTFTLKKTFDKIKEK